jgi:hypothetical protein
MAERWARSRANGPPPTGRMDAKHLLVLLLALVPVVWTSRTSAQPDRPPSNTQAEPSARAHDGVEGASCRDLRDAELILAEREVRLLDQLASQGALPGERESWKDELDGTRTSLEDLDRSLAEARCPPPSRGE